MRYIQPILISLFVTYMALHQHIFHERTILQFLFEHVIPVLIGLILATLFYIHRYGMIKI